MDNDDVPSALFRPLRWLHNPREEAKTMILIVLIRTSYGIVVLVWH
jgi:hypothetical protein